MEYEIAHAHAPKPVSLYILFEMSSRCCLFYTYMHIYFLNIRIHGQKLKYEEVMQQMF